MAARIRFYKPPDGRLVYEKKYDKFEAIASRIHNHAEFFTPQSNITMYTYLKLAYHGTYTFTVETEVPPPYWTTLGPQWKLVQYFLEDKITGDGPGLMASPVDVARRNRYEANEPEPEPPTDIRESIEVQIR